ncbi:hypothetical protein BDV95DRAFT_599453 [Massariosphaeria phaeospora]|uniref:Uncharacterized protein n=1 Tax=Massariosphaeria phaeospora TaxID=100035 RepID=A0A7C8M184_9PLEO|nr:hypothetical protein BDV95DRAFT_599453 [Massariosphaeria phaeospora]
MVLFLSRLRPVALLSLTILIPNTLSTTYAPTFEQQVLAAAAASTPSQSQEPPYKAPLRYSDGSFGEVIKGRYIVQLSPGFSFEDHCRNIGRDMDEYDVTVPKRVSMYICRGVDDAVLDAIRADTGVKEVFCVTTKEASLDEPVRTYAQDLLLRLARWLGVAWCGASSVAGHRGTLVSNTLAQKRPKDTIRPSSRYDEHEHVTATPRFPLSAAMQHESTPYHIVIRQVPLLALLRIVGSMSVYGELDLLLKKGTPYTHTSHTHIPNPPPQSLPMHPIHSPYLLHTAPKSVRPFLPSFPPSFLDLHSNSNMQPSPSATPLSQLN